MWRIGLGDFEKLIAGWNVNTGLGGFGKVNCGLGREYWFGGCGGWILVDCEVFGVVNRFGGFPKVDCGKLVLGGVVAGFA